MSESYIDRALPINIKLPPDLEAARVEDKRRIEEFKRFVGEQSTKDVDIGLPEEPNP